MKIKEYLINQCIRLYPPAEPRARDNVKILEVLRGCERRYGFFQGPRTLSEYNIETGITFLEGQFQKQFAIDKFQIFRHGVLVEGKLATSTLDEFIDDVLAWSRKEMGLPALQQSLIRRGYLSQLVVETSSSMADYLSNLKSMGVRMGEIIRSYGQNSPNFEPTGITLYGDIINLEMPRAGTQFIFARREGVPFSTNLFYASAPLRTDHHVQFLTELEKVFTRGAP